MKRHKWQPSEQHREDQISHQQLSAHQWGGMLTAPLQGPDKGEKKQRSACLWSFSGSTVLTLLGLLPLEGRGTPLPVLTERTSQWLRQKDINTFQHCVFLLWGDNPKVLSVSLHRKAIQRQFTSACLQEGGKKADRLSCLKASDNSKDRLTYCVRALTFRGVLHQAAPLQHFPPSL